MKLLCISILILVTQASIAQSIDSLFKIFERDIKIEQTYSGGRVFLDDDTRQSYYTLMKIAPKDSLIKFIDNPNPAIRCIIFRALLDKNADKKLLNKIVNNHLNDTALYKSQSTDVSVTFTVIEYMQIVQRDTIKMDYGEMLNKISQRPRIVLPGLRHGHIQKAEIIRIDSLVFLVFNYKDLKILSFTAIFVQNSGTEILKSESNFFTTAMKEKILQLKSGDIIILADIKVIVKDGTKRTFDSVNIRIEEKGNHY